MGTCPWQIDNDNEKPMTMMMMFGMMIMMTIIMMIMMMMIMMMMIAIKTVTHGCRMVPISRGPT